LVFAMSLIATVGGAGRVVIADPNRGATFDSPGSGAPVAADPIADSLSITQQLPLAPRSKNLTTGTFEWDDDDSTAMVSGKGEMRPPEGVIPPSVQVTHVKSPKQFASIRLSLDRAKARTLLGAPAGSASSHDALILEDSVGNQYKPIGWIRIKDNNSTLDVSIDPQSPVESIGDIPVAKMEKTDQMFVYFHVNRGVHLTKLKVGSRPAHDLDLKVPKQ